LNAVRAMLDRSTSALARLAKPAPFLLGEALTQSDLLAFFTFELVDRLTIHVWQRSMIFELGWTEWRRLVRGQASVCPVVAAFEASFYNYLQTHDAPFREELRAHEE